MWPANYFKYGKVTVSSVFVCISSDQNRFYPVCRKLIGWDPLKTIRTPCLIGEYGWNSYPTILSKMFFNSQSSNRKQISGLIWHQISTQVIWLRSFIPVWSGLGRFDQAYSCFGTKAQIFYKYLMGLIHNNQRRTEILQKF